MDEKDISIAHRLPTRSGAIKSIISERVAKNDLKRKKRELTKSTDTKELRTIEDLGPARAMFINLMESDSRNSSVWTKEGNNLYTLHNNSNFNIITNLYDEGIHLGYKLNGVISCFR